MSALCNVRMPHHASQLYMRCAGTLLWKFCLSSRSQVPTGEAFYFAIVTFTSIGYGDIAPSSVSAKVFFMLYIVASLVVQLTVVTTLAQSLASKAEQGDAQMPQSDGVRLPCNCCTCKLHAVSNDIGNLIVQHAGNVAMLCARCLAHEHGLSAECNMAQWRSLLTEFSMVQESPSAFFRVKPLLRRAAMRTGVLVAVVAAGAALLHYTEHFSWLDCAYWCAGCASACKGWLCRCLKKNAPVQLTPACEAAWQHLAGACAY